MLTDDMSDIVIGLTFNALATARLEHGRDLRGDDQWVLRYYRAERGWSLPVLTIHDRDTYEDVRSQIARAKERAA